MTKRSVLGVVLALSATTFGCSFSAGVAGESEGAPANSTTENSATPTEDSPSSFGKAGSSTSCSSDRDCASDASCVITRSGEITSGACVAKSGPPESSEAPDGGAPADTKPSAPADTKPSAPADTKPNLPECGAAIFGPDAPSARGGQRVKDSAGNLYFTSYMHTGLLARVPAGGGKIQPLVKDTETSSSGFAGSPFVADDGTVLFGASNSIRRFDPTTGAVTVVASYSTNGYGFSPVVDASGRMVAAGAHGTSNMFRSDGTALGLAPGFSNAYAAVHGDWFYRLTFVGSSAVVEQNCLDGKIHENMRTWPVRDAYGLVYGSDDNLYVTQGNTSPPGVFRVSPATNKVERIATIPGVYGATYLSGDDDGYLYVVGYPGNTVWRVNATTGERVVYGCETNGKYACGAAG